MLVVSFGGPEGPDDVMPFLENVLRGKNVPRERMLEVAEHYQHFGGVSPINAQNRALDRRAASELAAHGPQLPIYWGNRNWHPLLADTLRRMAADGVRRALAFLHLGLQLVFQLPAVPRGYRAAPRRASGPTAPQVDKLRVFFNHPGFIEPMIERVRDGASSRFPPSDAKRAAFIYTAHSIPLAMAANCRYVEHSSRKPRGWFRSGLGRSELAAGVSKPQRPAEPALAGARRRAMPCERSASRPTASATW